MARTDDFFMLVLWFKMHAKNAGGSGYHEHL